VMSGCLFSGVERAGKLSSPECAPISSPLSLFSLFRSRPISFPNVSQERSLPDFSYAVSLGLNLIFFTFVSRHPLFTWFSFLLPLRPTGQHGRLFPVLSPPLFTWGKPDLLGTQLPLQTLYRCFQVSGVLRPRPPPLFDQPFPFSPWLEAHICQVCTSTVAFHGCLRDRPSPFLLLELFPRCTF